MIADLPTVWLAPGAVSDPRPLLRFGSLEGVLLPVGPIAPGAARAGAETGRAGVGGVEHGDHACGPTVARELLAWSAARGLSCALSVRGRAGGELAEAASLARTSPDAEVVRVVEVDLRGVDEQTCLRWMSRVRENVPGGVLLAARISAGAGDLVPTARSAVAGGAGAVVVSGSTPLGPGRWWSGPSTLAATLAGVQHLAAAAEENRWPGAPLVAAGGIHDVSSARRVREAGASAIQLGTALWTDPRILGTLVDTFRRTP